jgi:phosphopentomutase
MDGLKLGDILIITADHGNDPTTPSTDHSRERVPLLVAGPQVKANTDLGTRTSFADVAATIAELLGVENFKPPGISFANSILKTS